MVDPGHTCHELGVIRFGPIAGDQDRRAWAPRGESGAPHPFSSKRRVNHRLEVGWAVVVVRVMADGALYGAGHARLRRKSPEPGPPFGRSIE
jgi:hypothetical protein